MASDFELDAMLEIDDSQVEEVNNELEADVNATGGDVTPAERDQQEQIVAGGVSKGLLGIGVFTAILSQLKTVTAIIDAVLGAISRALIPVVEQVAEFIRPIISTVNEAVQGSEQAQANVEGGAADAFNLANVIRGLAKRAVPIPVGAGQTVQPEDVGPNGRRKRGFAMQEILEALNQVDEGNRTQTPEFIANLLTDPSRTADQTGEQTKKQMSENTGDADDDKLGGGSTG